MFSTWTYPQCKACMWEIKPKTRSTRSWTFSILPLLLNPCITSRRTTSLTGSILTPLFFFYPPPPLPNSPLPLPWFVFDLISCTPWTWSLESSCTGKSHHNKPCQAGNCCFPTVLLVSCLSCARMSTLLTTSYSNYFPKVSIGPSCLPHCFLLLVSLPSHHLFSN